MVDDNPKFKRDVFAIVGLPPEVLAVAMAKYSRSQRSIRETIDELTEEKSAEFHEKWVLGYGDASVADMAVISLALENVSILASKAVEDHRLAAYQEKSTRYIPFDEERQLRFPLTLPLADEQTENLGRYYRPAAMLADPEAARLYLETCEKLFDQYRRVAQAMDSYYRRQYPKPAEMTDKAYASKVRARSLDVARYCLPVSTLTNFGMIMNARSLRHSIAVMKGSRLPEVREIAEEMQRAATSPAYNPQAKKIAPLLDTLRQHGDESVRRAAEELDAAIRLQVKGAPTLIKHTEAKVYLERTAAALTALAEKHLPPEPEPIAPRVLFHPDLGSYEEQLCAALLYPHCRWSFAHVLQTVRALTPERRSEIIDAGTKHRDRWDWPIRPYELSGQLVFDTLMDYGAFRDLQRHRMTAQLNQDFSPEHGAEIPHGLGTAEAGVEGMLEEAYAVSGETYRQLVKGFGAEAQYVLALGFRKRTLFAMNLRELFHIVELRTKPGGHLSYRTLVYDMYQAVSRFHPTLTKNMRLVTPDFPNEFFER